jgi:CRISPR-associated protein Cas5d
MKVERVSYPVMTPSAARGILEAVFWEPQMYYLIDSIRVVKRGQWISIRRNEVTRVISLDSAKTWMHSPEKTSPIQAGGGAEDGTQRNMLALQDVEYLITAEVRLTPLASDLLLSLSWPHLIDLIAIDAPWKRASYENEGRPRFLVWV